MKQKVIGIIGSRRRNHNDDYQAILNAFYKIYNENDWLVSGGCPKGGDYFAECIAKGEGIPILTFYPNWNKYGRGAGFARNNHIAKHSDILIACVAEDRKGGTEDTIKKFLRKIKMTEREAIKAKKLILV